MLNWWVLTMHWQSLPKTFKTHWPAGLVVCLKVLALLKKITDPTFFIARVTLHWKYVLHKKLKNTHQYQSLLSLIYDKVERQCKHLKNILHVSVWHWKYLSAHRTSYFIFTESSSKFTGLGLRTTQFSWRLHWYVYIYSYSFKILHRIANVLPVKIIISN